MPAVVLLTALLLAQAKMDSDECAVWQRELSFAQSVDNHNAKAFAAHLHPGTVFAAGTENPVRGGAAATPVDDLATAEKFMAQAPASGPAR